MTLLRFLLRTSRGILLVTALIAALSGACNAGLIALVTRRWISPAVRPRCWYGVSRASGFASS